MEYKLSDAALSMRLALQILTENAPAYGGIHEKLIMAQKLSVGDCVSLLCACYRNASADQFDVEVLATHFNAVYACGFNIDSFKYFAGGKVIV